MSCKHGLSSENVCWLCLGNEQEEVKGIGSPPWMANSTQMAIRSNYTLCRGYITEETAYGPTFMPKGSTDPNAKYSLPYRKCGEDNKVRKIRYDMTKKEK